MTGDVRLAPGIGGGHQVCQALAFFFVETYPLLSYTYTTADSNAAAYHGQPYDSAHLWAQVLHGHG